MKGSTAPSQAELRPDMFEEDISTSWIPDVAAGFDYSLVAEGVGHQEGRVTLLDLPRPNGRKMPVAVLPFDDHVALHRALAPAKARLQESLRPGVCGYRAGAEAGLGYRAEHARFQAFTEAAIEDGQWVAVADIQAFFRSLPLKVVRDALEGLAPEVVEPVWGLLKKWRAAGVVGLPPGYADTRFLANLVLHEIDQSISVPFARWVDDYRLFVPNLPTGERALGELSRNLRRLGLSFNESKVGVFSPTSARTQLIGRPLTSVFHPEDEPVSFQRAALRSVFADGASDPVENRRQLRFALPRLAFIGDEVAVPYACDALLEKTIPWETPRLVAYLQHFLDSGRVRDVACAAVVGAISQRDHWLVCRLLPLTMRVSERVDQNLVGALRRYLAEEPPAASWGMALRAVAILDTVQVSDVEHQYPDPRAALVALADAAIGPPARLEELAPLTAQALRHYGPAPFPRLDSLL